MDSDHIGHQSHHVHPVWIYRGLVCRRQKWSWCHLVRISRSIHLLGILFGRLLPHFLSSCSSFHRSHFDSIFVHFWIWPSVLLRVPDIFLPRDHTVLDDEYRGGTDVCHHGCYRLGSQGQDRIWESPSGTLSCRSCDYNHHSDYSISFCIWNDFIARGFKKFLFIRDGVHPATLLLHDDALLSICCLGHAAPIGVQKGLFWPVLLCRELNLLLQGHICVSAAQRARWKCLVCDSWWE